MLFVHFTPKSNLKRIKRMGLVPGKKERGVFLRPLIQGEKTLSNDWNRPELWGKDNARGQREMAKIIVRLPPDAMIRWTGMHGGEIRTADLITVRALGKELASETWRNWLSYRDAPGVVPTQFEFEVLYEEMIPPKWIVKILDHTNTDDRTRRYRRCIRRLEGKE